MKPLLRRLYGRKIPAIGGVIASYLTFSVGVIVTALLESSRHTVSEKFTDWNRWSVFFISAGMVVSWLALLFVMMRVEELQRTNRINFQYFDRNSGLGRTNLLNMARVMEDGTEILTLNYFNRKFKGFDANTERVRKMYFDVVEDKLGVINYRRIIQISPEADLRNMLDDSHLIHFRAVVDRRDGGGSGRVLQLARVPIRYPYSFIIFKRPNGLNFLSLDIFEEAPDSFAIVGSLHVTDPDGQLIAPFEALFRNLESHAKWTSVLSDQIAQDSI